MPEGSEPEVVLCINSGSSSLKFALIRVGADSEKVLASGTVEQLTSPKAVAFLSVGDERSERDCPNADVGTALAVALELLAERALPQPTLIGHRVVHGGREHTTATRVSSSLLDSLRRLIPLAPLHQPAAIHAMESMMDRSPGVPQVACFDTAFHSQMPECAARFPLPAVLYAEGVRRYGFHGLSYEYVLSTLGEPPPPRVIVAHLGNGASLVAIKNGRSIDTTMGFTPTGGIMMGTRSGDLDPSLVCYLQREKGYSLDALERLLTRESGLLGVAGTADMRNLMERRAEDPLAEMAIEMLGYAVRKVIGSYIAALGGLDMLVFTGGIGEHTPAVRAAACRDLAALGVVLDPTQNERGTGAIHAESSASRVLVVESDEDRMIARHAYAVVRS